MIRPQAQDNPRQQEPALELQDVLALEALAEEAVREAARVLANLWEEA